MQTSCKLLRYFSHSVFTFLLCAPAATHLQQQYVQAEEASLHQMLCPTMLLIQSLLSNYGLSPLAHNITLSMAGFGCDGSICPSATTRILRTSLLGPSLLHPTSTVLQWPQVEQQQHILTRKQEQAQSAREVLQQLKAAAEPDQQIAHLILQQNQPLYLARVLQACSYLLCQSTQRALLAATYDAVCCT